MKVPQYYSLLFFVSVLFFSCEKEEEPPLLLLNFQVEHVVNATYQCTWNASNISTFKKYYIVHSPFLLGRDDDPKLINHTRKTVVSSQETDNRSLSVTNYNGLPIYFQLFVDIGDRYVRSEVVSFETPRSETIDAEAASTLHYPEKNAIYLVNIGRRDINHYDYEEKELKENNEVDFSFRTATAQAGNNGFGDEIYAIDGNELVVINASTLEEKDRYATNGEIYSVATNNKGLIALSVRKPSNPILVLARENLTPVDTLGSFNSYNESRGLAFLHKENNELIEVGNYFTMYYKLDENGIKEESDYESNPFLPISTRGNVTVSPLGNYYVNSPRGQVFDSAMNGISDLHLLEEEYYTSYFFNKEETYLYAIVTDNSWSYIDKFSIPNFEFVGRKEFGYETSTLDLFYRDDEIQVVIFTRDFYCSHIRALNF